MLLNVGATVEFFNVDPDGFEFTSDDQKPLFGDDDNLTLYIIDSHRPINLLKNGSQITFSTGIFWSILPLLW